MYIKKLEGIEKKVTEPVPNVRNFLDKVSVSIGGLTSSVNDLKESNSIAHQSIFNELNRVNGILLANRGEISANAKEINGLKHITKKIEEKPDKFIPLWSSLIAAIVSGVVFLLSKLI